MDATNAGHARSTTTPKNIKLFKVSSKSAPPKQSSSHLYPNKNNQQENNGNEETTNHEPIIPRVEYEEESNARLLNELPPPPHVETNIEMADTTVHYENNQIEAQSETPPRPKVRKPPVKISFFKFGKLNVIAEITNKENKSVKTSDASVNTDPVVLKQVSSIETQTNEVELFLNSETEKFLDYLQSLVYDQFESNEIDELVEDHFRQARSQTVLDRSVQDRGKIIPDSPPPTKPTGATTRQQALNLSEQSSFSASPVAANNSIAESFRHCLFKKELINGQKKSSNRPSLDFLTMSSSRSSSSETIGPRSAAATSKYSDSNSSSVRLLDSSIIEDTPSKYSDDSMNRSELDVTLSRSMTRGLCVNAAKIVLENSARLETSATILMNKSTGGEALNKSKHVNISSNTRLSYDSNKNQTVVKNSTFIIPDTRGILPEDRNYNFKSDKHTIITDTIPMAENEPSHMPQLIITDTVQIDSVEEEMSRTTTTDSANSNQSDQQMAATLVFAEEVNENPKNNISLDTSKTSVNSTKAPLKRVVPKQATYHSSSSDLLNSFSDSSMTHAGLYATNATFSDNQHGNSRAVLPPAANDILGVSINASNNASMMNSSISTTNRSVIQTVKPANSRMNSLEMLPPPPLFAQNPTTSSSSNRSKIKLQGADSLTDSNMMKIDDICREMYSDQNQTINEDHGDVENRAAHAKAAFVIKSNNRKLEIACSLLKSDMKVVSFRIFLGVST
jgi:hypothetical protein